MWLLHLLPDSFLQFVVHAILVTGVLATVVSFFVINRLLRWFPGVSQYVTALQIASLLLLTAGVYFTGGYSAEMAWRERVAEMQAKVAAAEQQAQQATTTIDNKAKEKVRVIREKGVVVKQYIDREVVKYDNQCVIPNSVVRAHNAAARNEELK